MQFKSFEIIPPGTKFDFVGKRRVAVVLSLIVNLAILAWCVPAIHGLNFGVDFAGGTEMEIRFSRTVDPADIRRAVQDLGFGDATVQTYGPEEENSFLIRVGRIALVTDADVKRVVDAVQGRFPVTRWSFNAEAGDKIDFEFEQAPPVAALREAVESTGVRVSDVREEAGLTAGTRSFAVITQGIQDKIERDLDAKFADATPEVRRVEYVGPAVGRELRNQGIKAVLYAMALIVVYVGLRFDFKFAPGVIAAIVHDAIVALGYYAFSGREFNLTSIAVLLTIVGYSVNDTVVIYDRIRENQAKLKGKSLAEIVNLSINEVLGRTAMTTLLTALSLVGLLVYGVGSIFDFAAAMLFGLLSGSYSTWFIAGPMSIWLDDRAERKRARPGAQAQTPTPARATGK